MSAASRPRGGAGRWQKFPVWPSQGLPPPRHRPVIFSSGGSGQDELDEHLAAAQPVMQEERRKCEHELIRGLYLLIYRESLSLGLTHWYAVMARGLYVILRRLGIDFVRSARSRTITACVRLMWSTSRPSSNRCQDQSGTGESGAVNQVRSEA